MKNLGKASWLMLCVLVGVAVAVVPGCPGPGLKNVPLMIDQAGRMEVTSYQNLTLPNDPSGGKIISVIRDNKTEREYLVVSGTHATAGTAVILMPKGGE